MPKLLDAIREAVPDKTWSAAVRLVRQGCARIEEQEPDEIRISVRIPGRPVPHEVFLWPEDEDWGCDCGSRADACVHIAAAAITFEQRTKQREAPGGQATRDSKPTSSTTPAAPRVVHALRRARRGLSIERYIEIPAHGDTPPKRQAIRGSLARSAAWCSAGDLEVEAALLTRIGNRVPTELWPRLMKGLAEATVVTLDGRPVRCSAEPRSGVVRVRDDEDGFHVQLVRDPRIEEVFEGGVVRCGDCLHAIPRGQLDTNQRKVLMKGLHFGPNEVGRLVGEFLPRLEGRVPMDLATKRLPSTTPEPPRLHLLVEEGKQDRLEVLPTIVYGDPAVARVDRDRLVLLGRQRVPIRDIEREAKLRKQCSRFLGTAPGRRTVLDTEDAIRFARGPLRRFRGTVEGGDRAARFRIVHRDLSPSVSLHEAEPGSYRVELDGDGADPQALLRAWQRGSSVVPLMDGGFAPLPMAWLEEHGWTLAEIMDAREHDGTVPIHTAASLTELAEPEALPPSLAGLRRLAQDFQGLPVTPLPQDLRAELRPYQRRGVDWLAFLRDAELGGLLADDMGLGKTLQALVAIASVPGPSLVVAPTSVIRNWKAEAHRFLPGLQVCLYHGPGRELDTKAHMVITSYALLRRDIEAIEAVPWRYAVLDEAQAIKNPDSQVSRAARRIQARHRLALTGTPVENRLDELWSLFAFALPGFLGRRDAFAERVADAIIGPDQRQALAWLRRRVRPFILRRLKREVAKELPPRTEMLVRCELSEEERNVYEAVRLSALDQVRAAIGAKRSLGVLEALLRLRQASCHPGLLPGRDDTDSSKLQVLVEKLRSLASQGHRALVFSQWTSFLDLVEPALEDAGITSCRLDGSTRDRQAVVDQFQAPDGPAAFLLSLKAGGTGLNLTAADYVFHLDPWWNPAVEDQAVDRAHRIGQARPVFSVRLVAAGTVEERIVALQASKRELARAAIGDEGVLASQLSSDELLALFE